MPVPQPPELRQRAVELARAGHTPVGKLAKDLCHRADLGVIRTARRTRLRLDRTWPWARDIHQAMARLHQLVPGRLTPRLHLSTTTRTPGP